MTIVDKKKGYILPSKRGRNKKEIKRAHYKQKQHAKMECFFNIFQAE
jgi:hypothetical protein